MFLLNQREESLCNKLITFTSHYVPIKSNVERIEFGNPSPLHPIMFLLNQAMAFINFSIHTNFTSHYVPIKSSSDFSSSSFPFAFTSHYVPIKSVLSSYYLSTNNDFTSHYVPIKSHTYIILYFLRFSTSFLSTPEKTSQVDVRNLLNYLLTTLLTPHESMDCQLSHKNALS